MAASLVDWASGDQGASFGEDELDGPLSAEPPHPINWNLLSEYLRVWGPANIAFGGHRYCLWVPRSRAGGGQPAAPDRASV